MSWWNCEKGHDGNYEKLTQIVAPIMLPRRMHSRISFTSFASSHSPEFWSQFHQNFTRIFYACSSQKCKKIQSSCQSFCTFGIWVCKNCALNVDEIDTWSTKYTIVPTKHTARWHNPIEIIILVFNSHPLPVYLWKKLWDRKWFKPFN